MTIHIPEDRVPTRSNMYAVMDDHGCVEFYLLTEEQIEDSDDCTVTAVQRAYKLSDAEVSRVMTIEAWEDFVSDYQRGVSSVLDCIIRRQTGLFSEIKDQFDQIESLMDDGDLDFHGVHQVLKEIVGG